MLALSDMEETSSNFSKKPPLQPPTTKTLLCKPSTILNDSCRQDVVKMKGGGCLLVQAELGKTSSSDIAPFFQGTEVTSLAADIDGVEEVPSTVSTSLNWELAMNSPTSHQRLKLTVCVLYLTLTNEGWDTPINLS